MSNLETTCLDYIMECGMNGRVERIMKQHYLENGISEEMIDNATRLLSVVENKE